MNTISIWQESLLYFTLKSSLLLGVALLVGLGLAKLSSARRYWLWLSTVVALLLIAVALPLVPDWRVLPAPVWEVERAMMKVQIMNEPDPDMDVRHGKVEGPALTKTVERGAEAVVPVPAGNPLVSSTPHVRPSFSLVEFLPWLWLGGVALMLLRVGVSVWQLRRVERLSRLAAVEDLARLAVPPAEVAQHVGLKRMPHLLLGSVDCVPMVWGLWRSRLLLPEDCYAWSADKLRAVLLHEFEHLRRRDPLALMAGQVVQALHWFNPLSWLLLRRLRSDQEHACDDAALMRGMRASDYAQHLLDLSRHTRLAPGLSLCALAMARCAPVEGRLHAILDTKRPRQASSKVWSRLWLGVAATLALPLAMLHALEVSGFRAQILDRNGVVLAKNTGLIDRVYPLREKTPHFIGYTRQWVEERLNNQAYQVGGTGIEQQYDAKLRQGGDFKLTVDARLQKIALHVLAEAEVKRGAVVMMDPSNGEILAMVSVPSYDPELFIPRLSRETWERFLSDPTVPLMDRTLYHQAPGTVFAPVVGLALAAQKQEAKMHFCTGSVSYGGRVFPCGRSKSTPMGRAHGPTDITQAFVNGCQCYWYEAGNAVGIDRLEKMGLLMGFKQKHLQLDYEKEGYLPNLELLTKEREDKPNRLLARTAGVAVGQGVTCNPLQLTVMASALANGGSVPKPRLLLDGGAPVWTGNLLEAGVSEEGLNQVREGLRLAVQSAGGVDHAAHSSRFSIAGNASASVFYRNVGGTRVRDLNRFFVGFAPYENPTLAFAILTTEIEEKSGPIQPLAKRLVEMVLGNEEVPAETPNDVVPEPNEKSNNEGVGGALQKWEATDFKKMSPSRHNFDWVPYTRPLG